MFSQPKSWRLLCFAALFLPLASCAEEPPTRPILKRFIQILETRTYPSLVSIKVIQPPIAGRLIQPRTSCFGVLLNEDGLVAFPLWLKSDVKNVEVELHNGRKLTPQKVIRDERNEVGFLWLKRGKKPFVAAPLGDTRQMKNHRFGATIYRSGVGARLHRCLTTGKFRAGKNAPPRIVAESACSVPIDFDVLVNLKGEVIGIWGGKATLPIFVPIDRVKVTAKQWQKRHDH